MTQDCPDAKERNCSFLTGAVTTRLWIIGCSISLRISVLFYILRRAER